MFSRKFSFNAVFFFFSAKPFTKRQYFDIIIQMHKSLFYKSTLVILIAILVAGLGFLPTGLSAAAEKTVLAPAGYRYFDSPSSLYVSNGGISVTDGGSLISFDTDGGFKKETDLPAGTIKAFYFNDTLIRTTAGSICFGEIPVNINATGLAVGRDRLFMIAGNQLAVVTLDDYAVSYIPAAGTITAIAAYENTVFYVTEYNNNVILSKYDNSTATEIKKLKSPVDALACKSANNVCYISGNEFTVYDAANDNVEFSASAGFFIHEAYGYNGEIYFLTDTKDIRKLTVNNDFATILTSTSDSGGFLNSPASITARKDILCVTDQGNDRIAIYKNGSYAANIKVYDPQDAAIDYNGNIYIAASQSVKIYDSAYNAVRSLRIENNIHDIVSLAIDYSAPVDNTLYAVTDDGAVTDLTSDAHKTFNGGYVKIFITVLGDIYALNSSSEIVKLNKNDLSPDTSFAAVNVPGAVNFAVDALGNIYAAYTGSVVKYACQSNYAQESISLFSGSIGGIDISLIDAEEIKYGDIIVTDTKQNRLAVCEGMTAVMNDLDDTTNYYNEMTGAAHRVIDDNESIICGVSVQNADIYDKPVEMPAKYSLTKNTKLIIIDKLTYDKKGYWFVLTDVMGGTGIYGFINKNVLTSPFAYSSPNGEKCTVLANDTAIRKYPSVSAAKVSTASTGSNFDMLSFVNNYTDIYKNEWCRVSYGNGYEGYIMRGAVSIDGKIIIKDNDSMPKINAKIKAIANETVVATYSDENGENELDSIAVGTNVEVIGVFNISYEYTQIKYSYSDVSDNVIVRNCYVPTENIYYEETTIYQIIAFIVIAVIIILTIVLFIVKKRKENILANKEAKF